eukprot:gene16227-23338_t
MLIGYPVIATVERMRREGHCNLCLPLDVFALQRAICWPTQWNTLEAWEALQQYSLDN